MTDTEETTTCEQQPTADAEVKEETEQTEVKQEVKEETEVKQEVEEEVKKEPEEVPTNGNSEEPEKQDETATKSLTEEELDAMTHNEYYSKLVEQGFHKVRF